MNEPSKVYKDGTNGETYPERFPYVVQSDAEISELDFRAKQIKSLLIPSTPLYVSPKRFGRENDGGYVVIDDFRHSDTLFSIGISDDFSFDSAVGRRVKEVVMVDGTISPVALDTANSKFYEKLLVPEGDRSGVTLSELVKSHTGEDFILKMDIEGAEWEVLNSLTENFLVHFRQIVMELHYLNEVYDLEAHRKKIQALALLRQTHTLVNSHANNWGNFKIRGFTPLPDSVEVLYLRNDSYQFGESNVMAQRLSELNQPCNPSRPEILWL